MYSHNNGRLPLLLYLSSTREDGAEKAAHSFFSWREVQHRLTIGIHREHSNPHRSHWSAPSRGTMQLLHAQSVGKQTISSSFRFGSMFWVLGLCSQWLRLGFS